jgi:hypothetical protein
LTPAITRCSGTDGAAGANLGEQIVIRRKSFDWSSLLSA